MSEARSEALPKPKSEMKLEAGKYFPARFPLHIMEIEQGPISEHTHEFWEMVYVRRGRGEHRIGERRFALAPGDVYIIRPGQAHAYGPPHTSQISHSTRARAHNRSETEPLRIVNVLWMPSLVEEMLPRQAMEAQVLGGAPLVRLGGARAVRVEALLDEMKREQFAPGAWQETLLRHLFCTLLVILARAIGEEMPARHNTRADSASWQAEHEIVERATAWVEENHRRAIKIEQVASHVALSGSRLSHVFKAHTGRGVIEYLHEIRVARAASLLCLSRGSSGEIGREVGFCDPRFFRRVFARHTGCTPSDFRRHYGR